MMALEMTPPRKEGYSRWAQEYLLDPLNAVEAYQTAQTGGQYNNQIPTQHKTVTLDEYRSSQASNENGLGRSRSLLARSNKSKDKDNGESKEGGGIKRSSSIREKLIRRFTDENKDSERRQRSLGPLNEVSTNEVSRMENVNKRPERVTTPPAQKTPDIKIQQDKDDLHNQENKPIGRKPEDRYSNNPFRDAMLDAENLTPPSSPNQSLQRSSTNPFRRVGEKPPSPQYSPPRLPARSPQPHRSTHRHDGPRSPQPHRTTPRQEGPRSPHKPRSRGNPQVKRTPAADTIDNLDTSFGLFTFHHEGPYDATLSHRNRLPHKSPLEATKYGNAMALKATAPQDIENSLQFGRPLEGVALFPPGTNVGGGAVLDYEEYDVNRSEGNYRRYPGMQYRDEDLKGKGIEGYDGDLKEKKEKEAKHRRGKSLDAAAAIRINNDADDANSTELVETSLRRNGSTAGRLEGAAAKFKRTFSLKRKERRGIDA